MLIDSVEPPVQPFDKMLTRPIQNHTGWQLEDIRICMHHVVVSGARTFETGLPDHLDGLA
jgi:hypothetical protein